MKYIIEAVQKIYPRINLSDFTYSFTNDDGTLLANPIDGLNWFSSEFEKPTLDQINSEIIEIELEELQKEKLKELFDYYNSDECWKYKLNSVALNASITQTAEWFRGMIPVCAGRQFIMFTDTGTISIALAKEKADNINYKIQVEASFALKMKRIELESIINSSTVDGLNNDGVKVYLTKEELKLLDVKAFLGEVPRLIEIDNI